MTARLILPAGAPRDEWLAARRQGVTASEIAALLGISPFESPFDLYWKKTGQIPEDYDDERLSLGRHMEPWIAERFAVAHPDLHLTAPAGLWGSEDRAWQLATPDGLVCEDAGFGALPVAVWEGKTSGTYDGWGEDGTDEVPAYIAAQAQWQMDVLDVTTAYVACFFLATQKIRTYQLTWDQDDIDLMRARAIEFWQRIQDGNPPDIDGHTATTLALKRLYPDTSEGDTATIPADVAENYRQAKAALKAAEQAADEAENALRAAMRDAQYADDPAGKRIASRSIYNRKPYTVGPARIDRLNPSRTSKKEAAA